MSNVPWFIPNTLDGKTISYAGPFANTAARDAYITGYTGPHVLGTAFQHPGNPNDALPQAKTIVATQDGDKVYWSDGTITDV